MFFYSKIRFCNSILFLAGFALLLLIGAGCDRQTDYSPVPEIWYKSFFLVDTVDALGNPARMGILTFDFRDGDGDFGLATPNEDDPPALQHNLFLTGYFVQNSELQPIPESDPNSLLLYRIPLFDDQVFGKPHEGTVRVEIFLYTINYSAILYQFYVTDRSGNSSNTETTITVFTD